MKTLSIITINRNNVDGLKKTMDSVMSQNCTDYEYIIIDGASTDGSKELIQQYAENPLFKDLITYWISEPDTGIYNAMNKGIGIATGEYCLFLNSGDWLADNTRVQLISKAGYQEDIIYFDALIVMKNHPTTKRRFPDTITSSHFIKLQTLNHQNLLTKTILLKQYKYSESYKIVSDTDFLIKTLIIDNRTSKHISDCLSYYEAGNGVSASLQTRKQLMAEWDSLLLSYFPPKVYRDLKLLADYQDIYFGIMQYIYRCLVLIRKVFSSK